MEKEPLSPLSKLYQEKIKLVDQIGHMPHAESGSNSPDDNAQEQVMDDEKLAELGAKIDAVQEEIDKEELKNAA